MKQAFKILAPMLAVFLGTFGIAVTFTDCEEPPPGEVIILDGGEVFIDAGVPADVDASGIDAALN